MHCSVSGSPDRSQTRTVWSYDPLTMRRPSGEYPTLMTAFTCPRRPAGSTPLTMEWVAQMIRSTSLSGYGSAVAAIQGLDYLQALARVRCPTLVLAGEHDAAVTLEQSRLLTAAIPTATLEVLSGAPHVSHVEQPTVFLERVGGFLQQAG